MRTLGELIRTARIEQQWTQYELAERMNVSRATISNWENGVSEPDFRTLCDLSAVLRCDFIPRHTENTADLQPTERKMRVILGESSEISVRFPENPCEISAGTIDFRVNGSDFHGNTIEFRITAPFSLEFPVENR